MGFSTSGLYNERVYKFVTVLFLVLPLTFLIIAASLHNLYSFSASDFDIPEDVLSGSAHFGAFYGCADMTGMGEFNGVPNVSFAIHTCLSIRPDCTVRFKFDSSQGPQELDTDLGPDWSAHTHMLEGTRFICRGALSDMNVCCWCDRLIAGYR